MMIRTLLFLAVIVLALPGCRPTINCQDTGCSYGQKCNTSTGACDSLSFDCREGDTCEAGEVCDETNGQCRSDALRCADGNPCPAGLVCDGGTGFCRPAFRCSLDGCPAAEVCDLLTDRCVAKPCETDEGCPELFVCEEFRCRAGCRPDSTACPPGQACFFQTGDNFGACREQCLEDTQCPFGQYCLDQGNGSSCVLEPSCEADLDCRPDEVCRNSVCAQPPCALDDDCLLGQICEVSTGLCLDTACDEDVFGNLGGDQPANHSFESAFPLAPQDDCRSSTPPKCFYEDLRICRGRSDWFAITTQSTDILKIRVEQLTISPDLDVYVYDESRELLAQNQQTTPISAVSLASERDRVVYLEIRALTNAPANYALTITNDFCANDGFEENDQQASATILASGGNGDIGAKTCGFDDDWFVLEQLEATQRLTMEVVSGTPDLTVELLTPDGITIALGDEPLTMNRLGATGDYFILATPSLGQSGDYRLRYSVQPQYTCPDAGSTATPADARLLINSPDQGLLCPLDSIWEIDWLQVPSGLEGWLTLDVSWTQGAPALDISLHRGDSTSPEVVRTATPSATGARLVASLTAAETYYVRIASNQSLGRIIGKPEYTLSWTVTP